MLYIVAPILSALRSVRSVNKQTQIEPLFYSRPEFRAGPAVGRDGCTGLSFPPKFLPESLSGRSLRRREDPEPQTRC